MVCRRVGSTENSQRNANIFIIVDCRKHFLGCKISWSVTKIPTLDTARSKETKTFIIQPAEKVMYSANERVLEVFPKFWASGGLTSEGCTESCSLENGRC